MVANWGWAEQGKAFLFIDLGVDILMLLVFVMLMLIFGGDGFEKFGLSFVLLLWFAFEIAIVLFATWGGSKLFDIDFYIVYQIMTFGQCLCVESKKKD